MPRISRATTAVAALVLALAATLVATIPGVLGANSAAHANEADRPVLLIGVPGLQWSNAPVIGDALDPLIAADDLSAASLVVRSTTTEACPVDGWLAISAGNRASGPRSPACLTLTSPVGGTEVPHWDEYLALAAERSFEAQPGLLGDELAAADISTAAIGPGAAVALGTSAGVIENYTPYDAETPGADVEAAIAGSDVVVVDLGARFGPWSSATPDAAGERLAGEIADILDGAEASGRDPVIIISGISDGLAEDASLRFFAMTGLGHSSELSSSSTRQPGYVLATDQHATILDVVGIDPGETTAIGAPIAGTPSAVENLAAAAQDRERHADAQRPLLPAFTLFLVLANLALFAFVALGLRRPQIARTSALMREQVLRVLRVVALAIAALPAASFLTNLLPWWRVDVPALAVLGGVAVWDALIVVAALFGPWRRALLGPAAAVAGVTALVLGIDVLFGAPLQISAVMGISTLVAGRFYGMNNTSFSLFAASTLMIAMVVANSLVQRGHRQCAALVVVTIGLVAIVLDGAPFWGADFGGPPALLVAFGILALLAAGIRLTIKRVALVVVGAGVASLAIAFLDWLRPPAARTHLGRFFGDILSGDVWPVIGRKLDQNLTILLGNRPLTILAICGVLLVVFVLIRPVRSSLTAKGGGEYAWLSGGAPISAMSRQAPMLGPGLIAMAVAAGIGFAVNDSGIVIPALGVSLAVPLLLASCATWLLTSPTPGPDGDAQDRSESLVPESSASETSASETSAPS